MGLRTSSLVSAEGFYVKKLANNVVFSSSKCVGSSSIYRSFKARNRNTCTKKWHIWQCWLVIHIFRELLLPLAETSGPKIIIFVAFSAFQDVSLCSPWFCLYGNHSGCKHTDQ